MAALNFGHQCATLQILTDHHILYQYSFYLQTLYKQPYHTGTIMAGVKHITPKFKAVSESENAVQLLLFYSLKLLLDIDKFHRSFSFPQHHMWCS